MKRLWIAIAFLLRDYSKRKQYQIPPEDRLPMAAIGVRLSDEKHQRLKELAAAKNISVNKLIEELTTIALAEFDAETCFKLRASRGSVERGLELIQKGAKYFGD